MKDRGKAVLVSSDYNNSSSSSDLPCRKHPISNSSVGICAYCLKDRLIKLVCSDCGEQRLSSCSCSDNSCIVEVGSVGRISFLIENDKEMLAADHHDQIIPNLNTNTTVNLLKRSSSSSVDVKRSSSSSSSNGFWRLGRRLFRKKYMIRENKNDDNESEIWVSSAVSRSKSVCGIRGDDHSSEGGFAGLLSARASDFNNKAEYWHSDQSSTTERRSSVMKKDLISSEKYGLIDLLDGGDHDSGFIDLKLGFIDHRKSSATSEFNITDSESGFRLSKESDFSEFALDQSQYNNNQSFNYECPRGSLSGDCGGSCRITVNDHRDMNKKCKKSSKVWKWILKQQQQHHHHHHSSSATTTTTSAWKKDEDHGFRSRSGRD